MLEAMPRPVASSDPSTHFHGYSWRGPTADLANEYARRSENPDFRTSKLPPSFVRDWFLRQPSATWEDVDPAIEWLSQGYRSVEDQIRNPADWFGLETRQQWVRKELENGQEVVWSLPLKGDVTAAWYVIVCPDRWGVHPCPTGR